MPVLLRNEQYCQDVVYILEFYTNTVVDGYNKAGRQVTEETRIHIGGDQLTRERFSGAKAMRAHDNDPHDRFQCLRPISFEVSHMQWQCRRAHADHRICRFLRFKKNATHFRKMRQVDLVFYNIGRHLEF